VTSSEPPERDSIVKNIPLLKKEYSWRIVRPGGRVALYPVRT